MTKLSPFDAWLMSAEPFAVLCGVLGAAALGLIALLFWRDSGSR